MTARAKKNLNCVAFQRAQRKKLGKELEGMSSEETGVWMRDCRPTDPILRRFIEPSPKVKLRALGALLPSPGV